MALKFRTVINGVKKVATDHFGAEYVLAKDGQCWSVFIDGDLLPTAHGVSYQRAIKAANDAHAKSRSW